MKKLNKKGFTIVELVIVIAVIAILAAVMIPTFSGIITKAQQSAALQKATAKFKEAYALDLSDGVVDGEENGVPLADPNYSYNESTKKVSYTYTDGGIVASYDGATWTVTGSK